MHRFYKVIYMRYTLKILKIEIITLIYLKLDKIVPYCYVTLHLT